MPKILSRLSYVVTLAVVKLQKCLTPLWKGQARLNLCLKYHRRKCAMREMLSTKIETLGYVRLG